MLHKITTAVGHTYTKADRQRIIADFAARNHGVYDPKAFELEVRTTGSSHEAYDWFAWDETKAAYEYRLYQAREFGIGLKLIFTVQELKRRRFVVVEREMPFIISPLGGRAQGGGYYVTDPDNPEHMTEHCHQAAVALRGWFARYSAACGHVGILPNLRKLISALENA